MTAPSPGFRRLAVVTAAATLLLILLGGIVRLSDSGLGCGPAGSGFHGWPLCRGDLVPGLELNAVVEYSHRALASVVGLLAIALAVWAVRRHRARRGIVRAAIGGAVLVIAQGLLGALVVEENLQEALVAAHLGLAMLFLAVTMYIVRAARPEPAEPPAGTRGLRRLALAASALVLATIVAGGYVAGTEGYGRAGDQRTVGAGAHYACGTEFPTCNGGFFPFGQTRLADIHLTHRFFMYLATIAVVWLTIAALRRRPSPAVARWAHAAGGLLTLQILLGALNVWIAEQYELLILAHLMTGTLLWASVIGLVLELSRVGAPVGAGGPASAAAGARPAGDREPVTA